jgi:hypothetical protein
VLFINLEFVLAVCIIDEHDFDIVWEMVFQSLSQMPYDEKSNANKKKIRASSQVETALFGSEIQTQQQSTETIDHRY